MLTYRVNSENKYQLIEDFLRVYKDQYKAQLLGEMMGIIVTPSLGGFSREAIDQFKNADLRGSDPDTMPTEIRKQREGARKEALNELTEHLRVGLDRLEKVNV